MPIKVPENMKLRVVLEKEQEHKFLLDLHNDPDVLKNLTHPEPITLVEHLAWWKNTSNDSRQLRLIFCVNDTPAGFTKFYNIDNTNKNCVLGADLHKSFRGLGLAKYMWALMLKECFDVRKLHRVSLTTASYNIIAQNVYTNLGFLKEGTLVDSLFRDGKYHNQICMYMLRETWENPTLWK